MLSNWNYDILEGLIDESIDGDKWLNGRTITKNQYYKYPNGRIDYW